MLVVLMGYTTNSVIFPFLWKWLNNDEPADGSKGYPFAKQTHLMAMNQVKDQRIDCDRL